MFMILCLCSKSIHTRYHCRSDRAILLAEPEESGQWADIVAIGIEQINDYTLIRFEIQIRV